MSTYIFYKLADSLTQISPKGLPQNTPTNGTVTYVFGLVLNVLGAVALLVIVIAGLRYITSSGDAQKAAGARSTIVYALVGLIVAILAKFMINFVIHRTS